MFVLICLAIGWRPIQGVPPPTSRPKTFRDRLRLTHHPHEEDAHDGKSPNVDIFLHFISQTGLQLATRTTSHPESNQLHVSAAAGFASTVHGCNNCAAIKNVYVHTRVSMCVCVCRKRNDTHSIRDCGRRSLRCGRHAVGCYGNRPSPV